MRRLVPLPLVLLAAPAGAVDGAGLGAAELVGFLLLLFGAALPVLLTAGVVWVLISIVRAVLRKSEQPAAMHNLPPTVAPTALSPKEIEEMQRLNIHFNGSHFRVGDTRFERLVEAIAAVRKAGVGRNVP